MQVHLPYLGLVARELARLGIEAKAENGGARFFGSFEDAFRANLHARCADRILLVTEYAQRNLPGGK